MTLTPEQADGDELRELLANWQAAKRRISHAILWALYVLTAFAIPIGLAAAVYPGILEGLSHEGTH